MAEDEDKSQTRKIKARMKLAKTATMNQFDLAKLGLMKMTSKGNLYEPSTKGEVTFEGFLFKKSPGGIPLMRHWHKRWFVLESPGKLLYYADKDKSMLKGIIPLDMIERMLFRSTRLTLLMEGSENVPPRKFSLKAESEAIVKTWGAAIEKAFEELDRLEDQAEHDAKMDNIGEGDSKYWKVETRKKLNLSVALEEKPKKKKAAALKIDPRAKEIEAQIAEREAVERKQSVVAAVTPVASASEHVAGYMPLNDDHVEVPPPSSSSSSSPSSLYPVLDASPVCSPQQSQLSEDHERAERQRARAAQEEADLLAAIAASQMDVPAPLVAALEG